MRYERSQRGKLLIPSLIFAVAVLAVTVPIAIDEAPIAVVITVVVFVLVVGAVAMGSRMHVHVDETEVVASFAWGWPRRVIPMADIVAVDVVRNAWWMGWGLRWIPNGSMYNVWGRDAVELELVTGRVFRIGTDDPEGLLAAISPNVGVG
jgi:hypothetical protein